MFSRPLASPTLSVDTATATDTHSDVLEDLDFDLQYDEVIPCSMNEKYGYPDMHCEEPAVVLLQVCSGNVYGKCEEHLLESRRSKPLLICNKTCRWEEWHRHFRIVRWLR